VWFVSGGKGSTLGLVLQPHPSPIRKGQVCLGVAVESCSQLCAALLCCVGCLLMSCPYSLVLNAAGMQCLPITTALAAPGMHQVQGRYSAFAAGGSGAPAGWTMFVVCVV
jgi:hypothetical protein